MEVERLKERSLDTSDGLAESLAIAPVVSVGFASYLVAAYAGRATPATIMIAFIGTVALGWVFRQFARRYAGAGTVYEYLAIAGPRLPGVIAAGAYFFVALAGAAGGLVSGLLIRDFCAERLGFDPSWWAPGLLVLALVATLVHLGVRLSTRWILALTVTASLPLLVLTGAIFVKSGPQALTLGPFDPGNGDVIRGLLYAVFLFGGFEAAASLGEESSRPHHSIPRAMSLGIIACGVFYVVVLYATTVAFGAHGVRVTWGSNPLAVIELGDRWVGSPLSALVQLGTIVDLTAFMIAVTNVAARGYFTLARDRLLPKALATTSRRGTPLGGLALIVCANVVMMLVAIPFRDPYQVFNASASASPIISMTVYLVLCVLSVRLLIGTGASAWRYLVALVGALVPALGLYGSFVPFPSGARLAGLILAFASVLAAAIWTFWLNVRRKDALSTAAGHAVVVSAE